MTLLPALTSWLLRIDIPGTGQSGPEKPISAVDPTYFEVIERNTHILYPALAVIAIGVLVAGILQAWRTDALAGLDKEELKAKVIRELRIQLSGMTGDELARAIKLDGFKTSRLLEQMEKEGIIISYTNTQRLTLWRVKGL